MYQIVLADVVKDQRRSQIIGNTINAVVYVFKIRHNVFDVSCFQIRDDLPLVVFVPRYHVQERITDWANLSDEVIQSEFVAQDVETLITREVGLEEKDQP